MRRREFIALIGGGAVALPLAALAQQPPARRAVVVMGFPPGDPAGQARLAAFAEVLARHGWSDGRNVRLDIRWVGADIDRAKAVATELTTGSPPDVIVTSGYPLAALFHSRIQTIPIVFTQVSDSVGTGIVANIARPGGNITGFENFDPETGGKWLGLLKEAAPGINQVGVLLQPESNLPAFLRAIETLAPTLDVQITEISVHDLTEIERGIATFAGRGGGGLIVLPSPIFISNRDQMIALASRHRLPTIYPLRYFATSGGLIAYGIDQVEQWRGAAGYVDRILKGEKPGDLPVQAPTKYELIINLKTAKGLGLELPEKLLVRADEVID